MSKRFHKDFCQSLIDGSSYLKANIQCDKGNKKKFCCIPCEKMYNTKPLFFEYLHDHLESNRHQSTSKTPEEKDELNTALNYLRTKEQSQTSSKPNPNEQINAKMEIEAIEPQTNEHETQKHNLHFFRVQLSNFLIQNNLPFDLADRQLQFVQTLIQSHAPHNILNYTVNANHVSLVTSECFRPILQEKSLIC